MITCYIPEARWCVMNDKEMAKCEAMIAAVNHRSRDQDRPVPPGYTKYEELPQLSCFRGADQFDCMQKISENEADLVQLEPGLGYTGGEYFNMLPLAAERYDLGKDGHLFLLYNYIIYINKCHLFLKIK